MDKYCCSFVCGSESNCTFDCVGCEFMYDCEFCSNEGCEHHGKPEDEIDWEDLE